MQLNKSIKIFINYFLGPLLFAWLIFSIYRQVMHQPQLEESWLRIKQSLQSYKIIYLVLAILLIPINWGLEALKWQYSVRPVHRISFLQAFKATLSGVSVSVTMPNRVGEYLGRMMYLPEGSRLKTISVTLVGSFAQLLITIIAGTIGLISLKAELLQAFPGFRMGYQFALYGLLVSILLLGLLYFNVSAMEGFFRRWLRARRYGYLVEALRSFNRNLLMQVLVLSLLRYFVFIAQYALIFYVFEVNVPLDIIIAVMGVVFLAMAIIPSIALVEVGLRGEISIRLMGLFSANVLGIGFASVTVWFMNLILPAIAGSLLILNLKVFRKFNPAQRDDDN